MGPAPHGDEGDAHPGDWRARRLLEHTIPEGLHSAIAGLRDACFPAHATGRSYFKQLPHFRYLLFDDDDRLLAHLAVDHRVISVGGEVCSIFGLIDLCVAERARSRGLGSALLAAVAEEARSAGVDFLLLFADDHRLYERAGFTLVASTVTWLRIDEHRNFGLGVERIEGEMMVRPLQVRRWPGGAVDLLGYLF